MSDEENFPLEDHAERRADATPALPDPLQGNDGEPPPSRAEFLQLAAEVRRLAGQIAHGRA